MAFLFALTTNAGAGAGRITVDTTLDNYDENDGLCSLREAVEAANTETAVDTCTAGQGGVNIILFDPVTDGTPIILSDSLYITTDMYFTGNGEGVTILDGGNSNRIFYVNNSSETGFLNLSDLTLQNAMFDTENGGAIYGSHLAYFTATDVTIKNSLADYGGAIYLHDTSTSISNSTISNNSAEYGAGIFILNGSLNITNTTFRDNDATGAAFSYGAGGGLYSSYTDVTITDSTFSLNTAEHTGGGAFIFGTSNVDISDSTFSNNSANFIGGLNLEESSGSLNYVDFTGNTAAYSGGALGIKQSSNISVSYSTFDNNTTTDGNAGAIYVNNLSNLSLTNSTVSNNSANVFAGGLYAEEANVSVSYSTFNGNSAAEGGAMAESPMGGEIDLFNVTVSGNTASMKAGGFYISDASTDITFSTFTENTAYYANDLYLGAPPTVEANLFASGDSCATPGHEAALNRLGRELVSRIYSNGHNVEIENTCSLNSATDHYDQSDFTLEPLADNGGDTLTHALPYGSVAIDIFTEGTCYAEDDQRGVARPQGEYCDAGSYEDEGIEPPTAADDSATTVINTPVTIDVLANDSDPDGAIDASTLSIVDAPLVGTSSINNDGKVKITYTPAANQEGTVSFTYNVKDNDGATSNIATVTVSVTGPQNTNTGGGGGSNNSSTTTTTTTTGGGGSEVVLSAEEETVVDPCVFPDLDENHKNYTALMDLCARGIFTGNDDGTMAPDDEINRAEFLTVLVRSVTDADPLEDDFSSCFPDVISGEWYVAPVCYAYDQTWVEGYLGGDHVGYFLPDNSVNNVESVKMLLETHEVDLVEPTVAPFLDTPLDEWFTIYINTFKDLGLLDDLTDEFDPAKLMTRGEVAQYMYDMLTALEL
ncbi:right-handed parallel beta-helix repeat-containing protein [Patescibacteria group bacterium]|nr:right-handed parallel beta-helix repeat-containing protein [Patescibacteria group bacterium]